MPDLPPALSLLSVLIPFSKLEVLRRRTWQTQYSELVLCNVSSRTRAHKEKQKDTLGQKSPLKEKLLSGRWGMVRKGAEQDIKYLLDN